VDAFPVQTEQGQMIALRDPVGIATEILILSSDIFYLLQFFDSAHSLQDLHYEYMRAFGQLLPEQQLNHILTSLDDHLFLDNDSFSDKRRELETDFLSLPARPAAYAGKSYAADPQALKAELDDYYLAEKGAGLPTNQHADRDIRGIIAPHIDIAAGGPCYSHAYRALGESNRPDCFIILGTGHYGVENLYSILPKNFETPLGTVNCDLEFVESLKSNCNGFDHTEALPHRTEHSIEFQLVFLQHLLANYNGHVDHNYTFVPVLCSFSYHMLMEERFREERQKIEHFLTALRTTIAGFHKKVCMIASVDLSHVGVRYGDEKSPDAGFLAEVNHADTKILHAVAEMNAAAFHNCVAENQDRFRVCGYSSIYTMLNCINAEKGELLDYTSTAVDDKNSTVTFASMVLH
jgi:AmmeMemoRadiSam system protein B